MKYLIPIFLFCLMTNLLFSQSHNSFFAPNFDNFGYQVVVMDTSKVLLYGVHTRLFYFGQSTAFSADLDSLGEVADWQPIGDGAERIFGIDVLPLPDSGHVLAIQRSGCDYPNPVQFIRLDKTGSLLWQAEGVSGSFGIEQFAQSRADEFIFQADNYNVVDRFSLLDGAYIASSVNFSDFFNKTFSFPKQMFGMYEATLSVLSPDFTVDTTLDFPTPLVDMDTIQQGGFALLGDYEMYQLNADLELEHSASLDAPAFDVFTTQNRIWALFEDSIQERDFDLNLIQTHYFPTDFILKAGNHERERLYFVFENNKKNSGLSILKTDTGAFDLDFGLDVHLLDIITEDTVVYTTVFNPIQAAYNTAYGDVVLKITNESTDTLHSVDVIFDENYCPSFCTGKIQKKWTFSALSVAPQDTFSVKVFDFSTECGAFPPSRLCFSIRNGNGQSDYDMEDNVLCKTVLAVSPTTEIAADKGFTLYPNPADSYLSIRQNDGAWLSDQMAVELYNAQGQLVETMQPTNGLLDVQHLPVGLYLLRIKEGRNLLATFKVAVLR